MKRIPILLFSIIMCTHLQVSAQHKKTGKKHGAKAATEKKATVEKKAAGAQFKFKDGDTYDFGKVKAGPDVFHDFSFINTGDQPLIVQDVQPSCSCINPEWPKHPVLPGRKDVIKVAFHTSKAGPFSKEVHIQSNATLAAGEKRYTIYIKGSVVTE